MGHWGVRSYENDGAADAIDAAFERVHGAEYDALMDDGNPMTFDEVQAKLADGPTLAAALEALEAEAGSDRGAWDDEVKLAFCGIVVRFAEMGVAAGDADRTQAVEWLEAESIEWDETTKRGIRRSKEIALLSGKGHS